MTVTRPLHDRYMVPLQFHRLDELPVSMSGKSKGNPMARFATLPPLVDVKDESESLSPQQEALAEIWRKALQLPLPGLTAKSNFFDFGGSLQFVKLAATIKEDTGLTIPLADLLKAPTLTGVMETLNSNKEASGVEPPFDTPGEPPRRYPPFTRRYGLRVPLRHAQRRPIVPLPAALKEAAPSVTCPFMPLPTVAFRYHCMLPYAVTCRHIPWHAVTRHYMPLHAVTGEADKFPLKEVEATGEGYLDVLGAAREKTTKSVLVTGATGWLGAFVARRFAKDPRVNQVAHVTLMQRLCNACVSPTHRPRNAKDVRAPVATCRCLPSPAVTHRHLPLPTVSCRYSRHLPSPAVACCHLP